jgi:hypothetical protein
MPRDETSKPETRIHVIDAASAKSSPSYDMEAALASTVPSAVSFRLEGLPVMAGLLLWQRVVLTGLLENAGETPVTVTVFATGPLGFHAEPANTSARRKPPIGALSPPMQAPPPPLIIELPPMTAIRVTTDVLVNEYDWTPGAPREIDWSFLFWNEPRPKGRVGVP